MHLAQKPIQRAKKKSKNKIKCEEKKKESNETF